MFQKARTSSWERDGQKGIFQRSINPYNSAEKVKR